MKKYIRYRSILSILTFILVVVSLACVSLSSQLKQEIEIQLNWAREDELELNAVTASTLAMPETSNLLLTGTVKDATTGQALPATIHLIDEHPSGRLEKTIADDNGYFEIVRLPSLTGLRIDLPGYQAQEIDLTAWVSDTASELEIKLAPHKLSGLVLAADTNEPLSNVRLTTLSEVYSQTATTGPDGTFELYRLTANASVSVQPPEGYLPIDVLFGNQTILIFSLEPRQLAVTVRDSFYDVPLTGIELSLSKTFTATTDLDGQAILTHVPASTPISITHPGYLPVSLDYQTNEAITVDLIPAGLQGVVRDQETGEPLPQATLYLGETTLQADDDGHFIIEQLPKAPAQLMIKAAGYHRTYARLAQTGIFTGSVAPFSGLEGRWLTTTACAEKPARPELPCLDMQLASFQVKAIYVPFHYLGARELMLSYLDFVAATELNAIVVDVKGDFGFIGWDSEVELAELIGAEEWRQDYWMPLAELVAEAKKREVYTIARMVVFKDDPLARSKPEWATVREDGSAWIDGEGLGWANPFREEVWAYNIALAEEVASLGFDEINFDYIRFPSDGDVGAIVYEEENTLKTRTAAIREFMQRLTTALRPYGVFTSADVFGLTMWVDPESDMRIGQRIIDIAPHIDYLAPMIYPSTFIPGNLGYDNPSAEPYGIIFRSQNEAENRVPAHVKVRPWLQAYWYSLEEMQLQKQAANDAGSAGWWWWNAGGKYNEALFEGGGEE